MDAQEFFQIIELGEVAGKFKDRLVNQDDRKDIKRGGRRCLLVACVCLGLFCAVLLTVITAQNIVFSAERRSRENIISSLTLEIKDKSKGYTLFLTDEPGSWSDSRQYCTDRCGDLVIIESEEKQRSVTESVQERVWIGLSKTVHEGVMTWVDGSPLNQGFWYEHEPNDIDGTENCVELMPSSTSKLNNWNDMVCFDPKRGVCEFRIKK